jgi:hypothetical protein
MIFAVIMRYSTVIAVGPYRVFGSYLLHFPNVLMTRTVGFAVLSFCCNDDNQFNRFACVSIHSVM